MFSIFPFAWYYPDIYFQIMLIFIDYIHILAVIEYSFFLSYYYYNDSLNTVWLCSHHIHSILHSTCKWYLWKCFHNFFTFKSYFDFVYIIFHISFRLFSPLIILLIIQKYWNVIYSYYKFDVSSESFFSSCFILWYFPFSL